MIKRSAAILLIIISNITLLVHAVIPHHHHHEEVCIVSSHCDAESEEHHHQTNGHHHDQDGQKDSEYCGLNQITAVRISQVKSWHDEFNCIDCKFLFGGLVTDYIGLKSVVLDNLSKKQSVFLLPTYSCYTGRNVSSRAPPIA